MRRDPSRQAVKIYSSGISGGIALTIAIFVAYQLGKLNGRINISDRFHRHKNKREEKERDE